MPYARPIPWDIYEEHLDEAAFLWGQWESALDAANYTLDEVIEGPEERLLAHLDGLVLGGKRVADKLLVPALGDDDPGKVTAATWALLQAEDADHLELVFEALAAAEKKETRLAMGRAFELCHRKDLAVRLLPRLEASTPGVQAVIVTAVSAEEGRRGGPESYVPSGPLTPKLPLETLLATRNPELLVAALHALRRIRDPELAPLVEGPLASPYVAVRDAAIETGVVLGMRAAWRTCNKLVARNAPHCKLPLALLALGGEPVDLKTVIKRLEVNELKRDALWALGFAGTTEAADAALGLIDDEELGALAAESFATITGALMVGAMVKIGQTDNTLAPDVEEDEDAPPPSLKPEDDLPAPNGDRVRAWWRRARAGGAFQPGSRYVQGQVLAGEPVRRAIEGGPTWRRPVWCLEIAARFGVDVDEGAWGATQKRMSSGFAVDPQRDRLPMASARA
jgi:uncharacterized protein (TIGR02270 family)